MPALDAAEISEHWLLSPKDAAMVRARMFNSGSDESAKAADLRKAPSNAKRWTDDKLKALHSESILFGVTKQFLAEKHGVTRQRISALLRKAKDKFSMEVGKRATEFSAMVKPRTHKMK